MRVEKLKTAYPVEVKFTQFPLHPDTPQEGLTLEELFAGRNIDVAALQVQMRTLMEAEGLAYGERTRTYNSRLAQELAKWAETEPGGESIHDALFRAYFVEDMNLALVENLLKVVREVGLPEDRARQVLEERKLKEAVDRDWNRCREFGVTGVPTFVVGKQGVAGAQPYEVLEQLVERVGNSET